MLKENNMTEQKDNKAPLPLPPLETDEKKDKPGASIYLLLFLAIFTILLTAISSRGMAKRYAHGYGKTPMQTTGLLAWTGETVLNGITGGVVGLVYDNVHSNPGTLGDV